MKKIFSLLFVIPAVLATVAVAQSREMTPVRKLQYAEQIIENFYVDTPDTTKLVEDAIVAMLKDLDPHSTYTNAEETRELTEPLEGGFSGIGIRFQVLNDTLSVIEAISSGPSEQAGIMAGDKIIACNDTVIAGVKKKNSEIMKILRGPRGTVANLKVVRKNTPEPIDFRIVREDIPIYSVDASFMIDKNTGYIRIARFAESTTREVEDAMKSLKKKGMKNLIIDLTDNGGGYLRPAYEISNMFLRKGDRLVYTESPRAGRHDYVAETDGSFLDGKVVLMVNQFSASASEILSGAMQDNDRAAIVGRRTFGKGLVQRPFPFPDGSMMRLTVSRYYTPSGRCIQKPYADGDDDNYRHDMDNRLASGEFMSADSIHLNDSLRYYTLRNHRPVYGGGGIMPDRFVAIDTTFYTTYYRDLVAKGIVNRFCFDYVDDNRAALKKKYKNADKFIEEFAVTEDMMQNLIEFGEKEGVEYKADQYAVSREYLTTVVKALIGRDLYDQATYFRVANSLNPIYRAALDVMNTDGVYDRLLSGQK